MLHYYKFTSAIPDPVPARPTYGKRQKGRGWPDECPPLRAASSFGWDVVAAFEMVFKKRRDGSWRLEKEVEVASDWTWGAGEDEGEGKPLTQVNAWFWDENQTIPHTISKEVFAKLRNQVKVSTFLYLATDPNELLLMTGIPNQKLPYRVFTALVDTDWYPASYPWHIVIELDPREREIRIPKGTPFCRLATVRRDLYTAREMTPDEFEKFFERGQRWLARHGKGPASALMDITGAYARQQERSRFIVT